MADVQDSIDRMASEKTKHEQDERSRRITYGDFQTPVELARLVCRRLRALGIDPETIIEPTCGTGAFVEAAAETFPNAKRIMGFEINALHLDALRARSSFMVGPERIELLRADFFATDWQERVPRSEKNLLVIGNFPWATSAVQTLNKGDNLPPKSNFLARSGFEAITGKANFDISEWMLLEVLRWFEERTGEIAFLVKTGVARKILAHAQKQGASVKEAFLFRIDTKKEFAVTVEAGLLVLRFSADSRKNKYECTFFSSLDDCQGKRTGERMGAAVNDLDLFDRHAYLAGASPQKWRSGIKHDAAMAMVLTRREGFFKNGWGEIADVEPDLIYPLLKGSDISNGRAWRDRFVLVPQRCIGERTEALADTAPKTWRYLQNHADILDRRSSTIYAGKPRFSVFGVGQYAFRPWKIAICGLYEHLRFRLIGPIEDKPVMVDDTVYYLSFDDEAEALAVLAAIDSEPCRKLLSCLIFSGEKRPIKAAILNILDWSKLNAG